MMASWILVLRSAALVHPPARTSTCIEPLVFQPLLGPLPWYLSFSSLAQVPLTFRLRYTTYPVAAAPNAQAPWKASMAVTPATPPGRQGCQACLVDRCSTVSWLISSPSKSDRSGLHVMACRYPVVVQELCSLCFMLHFSQGPTVRHRTLVCPHAIAHVPIQTNRHSRPRLGVNMVRACASLVPRVGTNDDHTSNLGLKGTRVGFEPKPCWVRTHVASNPSTRRIETSCGRTVHVARFQRKERVSCFLFPPRGMHVRSGRGCGPKPRGCISDACERETLRALVSNLQRVLLRPRRAAMLLPRSGS